MAGDCRHASRSPFFRVYIVVILDCAGIFCVFFALERGGEQFMILSIFGPMETP
jgi:hypothetical protein